MAARPASPARLRAALVRRPHGVRGELRVEPLGGDAARFTPGLRLHREDAEQAWTVGTARALPDGDVLLTVDGVTARDQAEALRGAYLCVDTADARRLGDDEWFVHQLGGMGVVTPDGEPLGTVEDVEEYPEHEVLVIRDGARVRRLPMVRAFVRRVLVDRGVVEVTPWEEEP